MERALSLEFLRVVELAAIASARTMGLGDGMVRWRRRHLPGQVRDSILADDGGCKLLELLEELPQRA